MIFPFLSNNVQLVNTADTHVYDHGMEGGKFIDSGRENWENLHNVIKTGSTHSGTQDQTNGAEVVVVKLRW